MLVLARIGNSRPASNVRPSCPIRCSPASWQGGSGARGDGDKIQVSGRRPMPSSPYRSTCGPARATKNGKPGESQGRKATRLKRTCAPCRSRHRTPHFRCFPCPTFAVSVVDASRGMFGVRLGCALTPTARYSSPASLKSQGRRLQRRLGARYVSLCYSRRSPFVLLLPTTFLTGRTIRSHS